MGRTEDKLVVVGQGYVGLPVAVAAAENGFDVTGFEVDPRKVKLLNAGTSYVEDITDERLQGLIDAGVYRASGDAADMEAVRGKVGTMSA